MNWEWEKSEGKRLREEIITKLGGKCAKCGFTDARALQIDHVNGGGTKDRKSHARQVYYYRYVLSRIEPDAGEYQLLCANCNWIKRTEKQEAGDHNQQESLQAQVRKLEKQNGELLRKLDERKRELSARARALNQKEAARAAPHPLKSNESGVQKSADSSPSPQEVAEG